jgi:hypothetical protein
VAQLVALHEAQLPLLPRTAWLSPLLLRLIAAKSEMAREVSVLPQWVQAAGASALLMGRSCTKVTWQLPQTYS